MRVLICRICYGSWERCEIGDFIAEVYGGFRPPVTAVHLGRIDWQPTDCARNRAVVTMRQDEADVLFMIDADMVPNPGFWGAALAVLAEHPAAIVASPYCGQRQHGSFEHGHRVHVLTGCTNGKYERIGPGRAARRSGVEEVLAVGTGLVAVGKTAFDLVAPPWFDFRYTTPEHVTIARSEDFGFCVRLREAGGRVFCDWDHWSGHAKESIIGKPDPDEPDVAED